MTTKNTPHSDATLYMAKLEGNMTNILDTETLVNVGDIVTLIVMECSD